MSAFFLSQILAALAFAFGMASFQFRGKRGILLSMVACNAVNAAHFYLLGRPAPAALMLVTGARFTAASFTTDRRVMLFFLMCTAGAFLATAQNTLSLVACSGSLVATYGSFQAHERRLRLILMVGNSLWIAHNVLAATPVGALMEVAFLASNIVGYRRHHGKRAAELKEIS